MTEEEMGLPTRPARDVIRDVQGRLDAAGTAGERERYQFEHLSAPEQDVLLRQERGL